MTRGVGEDFVAGFVDGDEYEAGDVFCGGGCGGVDCWRGVLVDFIGVWSFFCFFLMGWRGEESEKGGGGLALANLSRG